MQIQRMELPQGGENAREKLYIRCLKGEYQIAGQSIQIGENTEGIAIGVISYVIINVVCGKTKKITPLMYVLAVLFVCKYIFL